MLSISPGHNVKYLTGPVAGGREGYYTGAVAAGEPPGRWSGAGAEALGLSGAVDADLMEAVYTHLLDPRDPAAHNRATWGEAEQLAAGHRKYRSADEIYNGLFEANPNAGPEQRAEFRTQAERSARQAVSFIDVTFSAPKSVTVLGVAFERAENDARRVGDDTAADAWATHRQAVEDAVMAGAQAALEYLQDVAGYSRVGHHGGGAGRWIDAHQFVVAQFLQHDSRDKDPHLHVHQAILNRVLCADGIWRSLDGRAIHEHRGAAGAIAERVMESHLAQALGVLFATRPDGKAREIVGIRQEVLDLFSSRRRAITAKAAELIDAFTGRFGRDPSSLERNRISQQATLATRASKRHDGETKEERLDRWEGEAQAAVAGGLSEVAQTVLGIAQQAPPAQEWSVEDVVERALATVAERRQSWTRSDLLRAVSDSLPGHVQVGPGQVRTLLEGLTDLAVVRAVRLSPDEDTAELPDELRLADGRSVYARPGGTRFAAPEQLGAERELRAAAIDRGADAFTTDDAAVVISRFAESGHELGADQAAAVRGILSSGAQLEVLSAAAGTGKSFTVGAVSEAWSASGRRVFGLAPSQVATQVLAAEGLTAMNTARWLATQTRLSNHQPGGGDEAYQLRPGDLVVVDEAGMVATGDLAAIHARCRAVGAKLLLVGDPRQLAAVGPGGALADLAERGLRYELAEVRRFSAEWERAASLQLRDGDAEAVEAYHRHGRLIDGGAAEHAEHAAGRAWLADTLAGRTSVLLVRDNESAARLSAQLRAELVSLGKVDEHGVQLVSQGTVAGVGDQVQARRNGWDLIGHDGNTRAPINRESYTVTGTGEDGSLTVVDAAGNALHLPADYVAQHVELGYASTVHAAQGRTVDTSHAVIAGGADPASVYVALTRGRDGNWAYVVTANVADDAQPGETLDASPRSARSVLSDIVDTDRAELQTSALAQAEAADEHAQSVQVHIDRLTAEVADVTAGRTATYLDRLAGDGVLTAQQRIELAADPAYGGLDRILRAAEVAGHNPEEVLRDAVTTRSLDDARSPAQVLYARISKTVDVTPEIVSFRDLVPADLPEDRRQRLEQLADRADTRRHELGAELAEDAPQWALESLGAVPEDPIDRADWEAKAGWAAAYRDLANHADDVDALGPPPAGGLAETNAAWRAAHSALDLPDRGPDERGMTDGRLRVRVTAYEREKNWAPAWVGDDLAAAHTAAQQAHTDATVWAARAEAAADPVEAAKHQAAADEAAAEADRLDEQVAALDEADDARAHWFLHTVFTRNAADAARVELAARGVDLAREPRVTAAEWLAEHDAATRDDDQHRDIGEQDVADDLVDDQVSETQHLAAAETAVLDARDVSTADAGEDTDRTPAAVEDTAALVARAQRALAELAQREAEEHAEAERAAQLNRWHADDLAGEDVETHDADDAMSR